MMRESWHICSSKGCNERIPRDGSALCVACQERADAAWKAMLGRLGG